MKVVALVPFALIAVFMLTVSSCGLGFSCHGAGSGLEERSSLIPNYDIYI